MTRLACFLTGRILPIAPRAIEMAARYATTRASLTAFGLLVLASAGVGQMETAYRQSIVKEGRYSLAETTQHRWRASDLRVGWKKKDAYVATRDQAVLEALSLARFSSLLCLLLTPVAWLTGARRRRAARPTGGGPSAFDAQPTRPPAPVAKA